MDTRSSGKSRRTSGDILRIDIWIGCRLCALSPKGDDGETLLKYWISEKTLPTGEYLASRAILQEEAAVDL